MPSDPVPAWRIREHALCPRRTYFSDGFTGGGPGLLYEITLRRHEALLDADCLERNSLRDALAALTHRIKKDYRHIWDEEPDPIPDDWVLNETAAILDRHDDYAEAVEAETPDETELLLTSHDLDLSGRLHLVRRGLPVLIKTGSAPSRGAWKPDRAQATAYALLLAEEHGATVDRAIVEYPREHAVRTVTVRPHHRRRVLELRDSVRRVLRDRRLPRQRNENLCPHCRHDETCREEPRTLKERIFDR